MGPFFLLDRHFQYHPGTPDSGVAPFGIDFERLNGGNTDDGPWIFPGSSLTFFPENNQIQSPTPATMPPIIGLSVFINIPPIRRQRTGMVRLLGYDEFGVTIFP